MSCGLCCSIHEIDGQNPGVLGRDGDQQFYVLMVERINLQKERVSVPCYSPIPCRTPVDNLDTERLRIVGMKFVSCA